MQPKRKDTDRLRDLQPGDPNWFLMMRRNRPFSPPTDVIELADKLIVLMEIAGMRAGNFNITLLNSQLIITGTREQPQHPNAAYHQVEIGYGEFRIEVNLPWLVERDEVSAIYEAGFLQIELPRKTVQPIQIVDVSKADEEQDQR